MFNWLFGKNEDEGSEVPSQLPYDSIVVSGKKSYAVLKKLKVEGTGKFIPVILGDPQRWQSTPVKLYTQEVITEILSRADNLVPEEVISKKSTELLSDHIDEDDGDDYFTREVLNGEWPDYVEPASEITGHTNILTGKPLSEVAICKVPTRHSWEVPAYLQFGEWNDCPSSEEHVALFRYWSEKYGAEIITVTQDVIECVVSKPPQTQEEALVLAKEQLFFCPDIVMQVTGSVQALAGCLLNGTVWFFWWD